MLIVENNKSVLIPYLGSQHRMLPAAALAPAADTDRYLRPAPELQQTS